MYSCPSKSKPKPRRRRPRSAPASSKPKCLRPGPITRNPYLNFLRDYRKKNCGLTCIEIVIRGAKCWKCLNAREKCRYIQMARQAPKRKVNRRRKKIC